MHETDFVNIRNNDFNFPFRNNLRQAIFHPIIVGYGVLKLRGKSHEYGLAGKFY